MIQSHRFASLCFMCACMCVYMLLKFSCSLLGQLEVAGLPVFQICRKLHYKAAPWFDDKPKICPLRCSSPAYEHHLLGKHLTTVVSTQKSYRPEILHRSHKSIGFNGDTLVTSSKKTLASKLITRIILGGYISLCGNQGTRLSSVAAKNSV